MRLGWISGRVIALVMMLPILGGFGREAWEEGGVSALGRMSGGCK